MTKKIMTTKFLSAAFFAALALSSCSNDVEDINSPGAPLSEGVTRMVFTFGERGVTPYGTRMTDAQEKDLTGLAAYFLAVDETGASVYIGNAAFTQNTSNITFDVAEDYYNQEIKAFLMRGGTGIPSVPAVGTSYSEDNFRDAVVSDDLTSASNLPLAGEATFNASGGTQSVPVNLKRRVGKIYVKTGTLTGVEASNVSVKNISLKNTPDRGMYFDDAPATDLQLVTRTFQVNQTLDALTASGDGLAYGYASSTGTSTLDVVISVDGTDFTESLAFDPTPNHKYALTINVNNTGTNLPTDVTMSITMTDWTDENGGTVDFDTNANALINSSFSDAQTGVKVESGKLMIPALMDEAAKLSLTDFIKGYTIDGTNYGITMEATADTRAVTNLTFTAEEADGTFTINAPANYSGSDKTFSLKVEVIDMNNNNSVVKSTTVPVVLQSKTLPENFLVSMAGNEWMSVNTNGDIDKDIEIVNAINNATGANFPAKYKNYLKSNETILGKTTSGGFAPGQKSCPKGFKLPSVDDYKTLLGNVSTGSSPWQYAVQARDTEETVTGKNIKVSVNTISPALRNSVHTYREVVDGETSLFMIAPPTSGTYGGAHTSTSGINISLNADKTTKTFFSLTTLYNTVGLVSRCVKDTNASAYWN